MTKTYIEQQIDSKTYRHPVVFPEGKGHHPLVVIVPDYHGCTDYASREAALWAKRGCVGMVMDLYGDAAMPLTGPDAAEAIGPHMMDRDSNILLMKNIITQAGSHESIDAARIGMIGYSSGGMFVLDAARGGIKISCVASVWGVMLPLVNVPPPMQPADPVHAAILMIQGGQDDFVPMYIMKGCVADLERRKADYQLHIMGGARHAFSLKEEDNLEIKSGENPTLLLYDRKAAERSDVLVHGFMKDHLDLS